jgi:cytosine deaminase
MPAWTAVPPGDRLVLAHARVPRALVGEAVAGAGDFHTCDIVIERGRIAAVQPAGSASGPTLALDHGIVLPGFVDIHTHLDKGHIWPRRANPDGTFMGALSNVGLDREAHWTAADVRARLEFSLAAAYAHGTVAVRTHLDSIGKQVPISWPVFAEAREDWRGRIDLQAAAIFGIDYIRDESAFRDLLATLSRHGGLMGGVTYMVPDLDLLLDRLFQGAAAHGLDVDLHVDETDDPDARSLLHIAEAVLRNRFTGKVLCGHCCSLAVQEPEVEAKIIDRVGEAGLAVVSLPLCNMYLQDRTAGRTPRWRGVTPLHALASAGVPVMIASDNTRDPFYAYGDMDMLEVFREATRIVHLDHPFGEWPRLMGRTAADWMGLPGHGRIATGAVADLVVTRARSWTELLSRPQADRLVLRAGKAIDTTLPDYRDLDATLGCQP